ncbi:MAG: hypothetical protein ABR505_00835 [Actinomycetota bacterium]
MRPLLPPMRKTSSVVAEYVGVVLTPLLFVGMLISLRFAFDGPNWECSGSGCLEEFDRLRGWTFPIPLFVMIFITTFGFVAALLLYLWGRGGRPPSFDPQPRRGRPALAGVPKTLLWVGMLELALAGTFAFAGVWVAAAPLGVTGLVLLLWARAMAAKSAAADRILQSGVPAVAELTAVGRTGTEMNDQPLLKLTLTVIQDGVPLYALVHKEYVPLHYMGRLQIGARLPIKVDPLDSNNIVIEWDKTPAELPGV